MKSFLSLLVAGFVLPLFSAAQVVDDVVKQYPNEMAVMTKYNRETKIFFQDGKPVAHSTEEVEMLMLDDRANGLYNKYSIYHGLFDELKDVEAYTKVPDGSKYKKIRVTDIKTENAISRGIFYDDVKQSIFDFPSLIKGAIAYETHKEYHKDVHLLSPFYFASYMPVMESRFSISFPADVDVRYIIKNDPQKKVTVTEDKKGRTRTFEFTANNIKMFDRYGNGPARAYYEPHVIVYIASYKDGDNVVPFLGSVEDLYHWNYSFLKGINEAPAPVLKHLADSLTAGASSDKEKAHRIYKWVQDHIKYVAFEEGLEGFIPRQAADVCNKKYGDCKDMASLLTELLQTAGLDAHFTWIGTRDIPYDYSEVPLPIVDNHMISAVKLNKEWVFLDGTDPNCEFGYPTHAIQGKQALIAFDDKKFEVVRVPEMEALRSKMIDTTFISIGDNGIKGNTSAYYHGYFGNDIFNSLQYRDSKDTREYVKARLSKASNKYIMGDFNVNPLGADNKSIRLNASFEIPDYGKKVGDEYYINLNLDKFYTASAIDTAKRKIPVENNYKYIVTQYTVLDVPPAYMVSYLPKNFNYSDNLVDFSIQYLKENNKVIATQQIKSNVLFMQPSDFVKWNAAVKELSSQYKEQLVLQKK
jgi:transglutaminase-like putative cysteine protease